MLDINGYYKRNENIIIKNLGGKQWALDMKDGGEYTLNEVSYDILNVLSKPCTVDDVLDEITSIYDVSRDILDADCKAWMSVALEKGLIEKV